MTVHLRRRAAAPTTRALWCAIGCAVVLALVVGILGSPASASPMTARPHPASLHPFRVDVSRYPRIGLVVTIPRAGPGLTSRDVRVRIGASAITPYLHHLWSGNIQLVVAPDTGGSAALLHSEQAAAAGFLLGMPQAAQTAVADPGRPRLMAGGMTGDPTAPVAQIAELAPSAARTVASRLATALSAFSAGARVRRTVVLVVTSGGNLGPAAARHLRKQLAASGTALYVLDASPHGAAEYGALAAGSGGFAVRVRVPADWQSGFRHITRDLADQYYLRFTDPAPLPGRARIVVTARAGRLRGIAMLPAANPVAPPAIVPAPRTRRPLQDWPLTLLGILLIGGVLCYGLAMLAASRREPRRRDGRRPVPAAAPDPHPPDGLFFVFLMPCLNEEKVIVNSLQRLLSIPGDDFAVLVIDDGSDDNTAATVSGLLGDHVWLLQRRAPHARQGKGEALNAGIDHLTRSGLLDRRDLDDVIIVVVDADGRIDPHALAMARPYFADPTVGAVQIGVRINNRTTSRLARMQDMEFVLYTEIFQRGRRHLGSVGLGGNGQFMRLSALRSLGASPWSRSLTEDLDLGVRLLAHGWRNEYCHTAAVHQQGVVELRRLIRQRSRWFQGHMQSWKLIPTVVRDVPHRARADLLYHLSSPAILLIASLLSASFVLSLVNCAVLAIHGHDPFGWWIATTYALSFGPALLFSCVYWTRERDNGLSFIRVMGLAHLYVCYCLMWYAAGWWAVGRTLRRRTGWAKTERVAETPVAQPALAGVRQVPAAQEGMAAVGATIPLTAVAAASSGSSPARPAAAGHPVTPAAAGSPATPAAAGSPATPVSAAPARNEGTRNGRPPPRRQRGRRKRVAIAITALAFLAAGTATLWAVREGPAQPSQWYSVFNGYGTNAVTGSGDQQVITLAPARARTLHDTHAALVLGRAWYHDFVVTANVRTIRQLRRGAAGRPNPWEVGWVVWHYTSNQHFYALTLEQRGWLLSKQDPKYPGGERFLASGELPRFPLGITHRVRIAQIGNRITVSADGHVLTQFTDTQRPYLSGAFGFYSEDAVASLGHIRLSPLQPIGAPQPQPSRKPRNQVSPSPVPAAVVSPA
jgi:1,2-diacylglycerol 3-beta-glucosyltransferase